MLKRQRPASPPPLPTTFSFSETPLAYITDPVDPVGLIERHHKKRRTLPPSLDGTARGWAKPHERHISFSNTSRFSANGNINDDDDDNEEPYEDEYEDEDNGADFQQQYYASSPYKSTNQLLRELHTVNQHRLLFASPSQNQQQQQQHASGSGSVQHQHHHQHQHQQHQFGFNHHHHQPQQQQVPQPCHFLPNIGHGVDEMTSHRRQEWPRPGLAATPPEDEICRVTERYESTNKLLGSLFLSRRKQLEPLDDTRYLES